MTKTLLAKVGLSIFGVYAGLAFSGFNTAYATTAKPVDTSKLLANLPIAEASAIDTASVVDTTDGTLMSGRILRGAARGAALGAIGGAIAGGKAGKGAAIGAAVGGILGAF